MQRAVVLMSGHAGVGMQQLGGAHTLNPVMACFTCVDQAEMGIVESLGKFSRTLKPGFSCLIPCIENHVGRCARRRRVAKPLFLGSLQSVSLQAGSVQSGSLQSRTTDFGAGLPNP
jgi:hypothetical protein